MKKILLLVAIMVTSVVASVAQFSTLMKSPEKAIYIPHLNKYIVSQANGLLIIDEDRKSNPEHFKYLEEPPCISYVDGVLYAGIEDFLFMYPNADISNEIQSYNEQGYHYISLAVCPGSDGYDMVAIMKDIRSLVQVTKPKKHVSKVETILPKFPDEILKLVTFKGGTLYIVTNKGATSTVYTYERKTETLETVYEIHNDPNLKDIAFDPEGNAYLLFSNPENKLSSLTLLKTDGFNKTLIEKMEYASGITFREDKRSLVVTHPLSDTIRLQLIGAPPAVKLIYPADKEEVEGKIVRFKWEEIEGAAAYELETAEDKEMVLNYQQYFTVKPEADPLKFEKGKTYYWRVRATNMGEIGPWSDIFEFKISENDIPAPTLVTPENNAKDVRLKPYFTWTKYKPHYRYEFQLSIVNTFAQYSIHGKEFINSSYQVVHELKPKTTYYWRVRTYADIEDPSPWSEVFTFTTRGLPPNPPNLHYPLTNQINVERHPRFRWSEVEGAESYELNISISAKYDNPDSTFYYNVKARPGEAEQTFILTDTILMYNTHYYFRVKAKTEKEGTAWSESRRFQVINKKDDNGGGGGGGGGDTSSVSQSPDLLLYPQPVREVLFLSLDNSDLSTYDLAGYNLRIVNAAGREISEFSHALLTDKLKIDVSRLSVGAYNLILELSGNVIVSKKFIKE